MRRAPWKIIAGGLALSLGGAAAVVGLPGKGGSVACGAPQQVEQPCPIIPPLPAASAQPQLPTTTAPTIVLTPGDLPPIPTAPVIPAQATEPAPMPRTVTEYEVRLPMIATAAAIESPPAYATPPVPVATPKPAPVEVPSPTAVPTPAPVTLPEPLVTTYVPVTAPTPVQVQVATPPASTACEKKLKVTLHMSDERPKFVVRDGEEIYLKVVCDRVEVKSPSDHGEAMSVLKAIGKISFVTPGGEGECEELTVVPGTGQVIVGGKVSFKYNWGKVETTVSGDRMAFRLGSAPSAPTMVPAGFQMRK